MKKTLLLVTLMVFCAHAQKDTLRVDVSLFEPMVMKSDDGKLTGFDIELWQNIAEYLKIPYNVTVVDQFKDIIPRLEANISDVAISGITINESREKTIDFTHKYYDSGLAILIRGEDTGGIWAQLIQYLNIIKKLNYILLFYIIFLVIMAFLYNRIEKWPLFDCFYFVNTIISTVGFGDISAKTKIGKVLVQFTMLVGIGIFSLITGAISSEITVQKLTYNINGPEDLRNKIVAVEEGTTSDAVKNYGAKIHAMPSIEKAVEALRNKTVDAVVYDLPGVLHIAKNNKDLIALSNTFDKQSYGIALRQGSPFREDINRALLHLMNTGKYTEIYNKYFGE